MASRAVLFNIVLFLALGQLAGPAQAQTYNVLEECSIQSPGVNEVHACLDNYLDIMDANIDDMKAFLNQTLQGESLAGFQRSQQAFVQYRRQNCLWYLEFSSPRSEAEQIAKNCLATMSQQRLSELQRLMATDKSVGNTLRGFYVYGPNRNSFQLCGKDARYWVEGDNTVVSQIQQEYLSAATADLQVIYVNVKGELDDELQTVDGHQGVIRLSEVIEVRVPSESDCRIPGGQNNVFSELSTTAAPLAAAAAVEPEPEVLEEQEEPQQQLVAYFGAWLADCIENDGNRRCNLQVGMQTDGGTSVSDEELPTLSLSRKTRQRTALEVRFPKREIDTPQRIRWGVDAYVFGDILGSEIRVDETATRQLVNERRFINEDLMPLMMGGGKLTLDVLASVDDRSGDKFSATLRGLTRALAFADEFVSDGR